MVGANNFPALIQELQSELNQGGNHEGSRQDGVQNGVGGQEGRQQDGWQDGWQVRAHEVVRGRLQSPYEFLDWAKRDRHWSFTLAEVMREVCSKPSELAVRLLIAILEELREEQQTVRSMSMSMSTSD
jgi:hypothetical protein